MSAGLHLTTRSSTLPSGGLIVRLAAPPRLRRWCMPVIVEDPTPYPEVNALVRELMTSVQTVLGNHFVGRGHVKKCVNELRRRSSPRGLPVVVAGSPRG